MVCVCERECVRVYVYGCVRKKGLTSVCPGRRAALPPSGSVPGAALLPAVAVVAVVALLVVVAAAAAGMIMSGLGVGCLRRREGPEEGESWTILKPTRGRVRGFWHKREGWG